MSAVSRKLYPSRSAGVRTLRAKGLPVSEIAKQLGCTEHQVIKDDWRHRQTLNGASIPFITSSSRIADLLPEDRELRGKARKAAARRDLPLESLLRDLLVTAIEADLIDAVLDDGDDWRAA